jgi:uncharacterized protein YbjQ (UPF0145 family)
MRKVGAQPEAASVLTAVDVLALRSAGFAASPPIRSGKVLLLPPVVDTIGMTAPATTRRLRVDLVVRCRRELLQQLRDEARLRGASGLVGLHFTERPTGFAAPAAATGTAVELSVTAIPVTAVRGAQPTNPFSTAINPVGVAAMMRGGWMPVEVLTAGTTKTRSRQHRSEDAAAATGRNNRELPGPTDMIQRARRNLRDQFRSAAASVGADGVLIDGDFEVTWSSTLHLVQVSAVANVVACFHDSKRFIDPRIALTMGNG